MKLLRPKQLLLGGGIIVSLFFNLLFFIGDGLYEIRLFVQSCANEQLSEVVESDEEFYNQLIPASWDMVDEGWRQQLPQIHRGQRFKSRMDFVLNGNRHITYTSAEEQYLTLGLLKYAIDHKDKELVLKIKEHFDKKVMPLDLLIVDQSIAGIVSNKLYSYFKEDKYKDYSNKIFIWLKGKDSLWGIKYRDGDRLIKVTGLGMTVLFLCSYSKTFNNTEAYKLALKQINMFNHYGVDKESGLPCQAFSISSPYIKVGTANWGRGCSFYLCGLLLIDENDLSKESQENISKMRSTLIELLNRDGYISKMIGIEGKIDLTATLPTLYYLLAKKQIESNQINLLKYSQYMHDGVLYNSNGPISGINGIGDMFGPNPLSQGFMIMLLNDFK